MMPSLRGASMLGMKVGQFPVETVLVEEKIDIEREFFLSFAIDDAARAPVIIFATGGGTGIEERAASTKRIDPVKHGYDGAATEKRNEIMKLQGAAVCNRRPNKTAIANRRSLRLAQRRR